MNLVRRDAELRGRGDDFGTESFRPADVHVAGGDIGRKMAERPRVEADALPGTDEFVHAAIVVLGQRSDLGAMNQVGRRRCADHDDHVGPLRQILEERAQRGDAHAGPDEQHRVGRSGVLGERAVWSLDGDCRAWP